MKAEFQLTVDDYVDAQRAHVRKALGKKVIVFWAILALVSLLYLWALTHPSSQLFLQLKPAGYFVLAGTALIIYAASGLPYRRQFRKTTSLHAPFVIEADPEAITYTGPNGESRTRWQGFVDFQESKKSFILYTQRNLFFILPKRVLGPEQITSFRELAKAHISTKSQSIK